jgi:hypothetical protein
VCESLSVYEHVRMHGVIVRAYLEATVLSARETWSAMYRREIPRGPPRPDISVSKYKR